MFDDLFKDLLDGLPKEGKWKTTTTTTTTADQKEDFSLDKLVVSAETDGSVKIDINGAYYVTVPGVLRHQFLEKLQKAVDMADVADPDNEPLNRGMKQG